MKKQVKLLLAAVLCFSLIFASVASVLIRQPLEQKEYEESGAVNLKTYDVDDDFVILEIVPDLSYAQLGYGIAGDEPVDIFKVCAQGSKEAYNGMISLMGGSNAVSELEKISEDDFEDLQAVYKDVDLDKYFTLTTGSAIYGKRPMYQFKGDNRFVLNKSWLERVMSPILQETGHDGVRVLTYTSKQINDSELTSSSNTILKDVDLIVVNGSYPSELKNGMRAIGTDFLKLDKDTTNTFLNKDLDFDVVSAIFKRVGDKTGCTPMIMDADIYSSALEQSSKEVTTYQYKVNRFAKYNYSASGIEPRETSVSLSDIMSLQKEDKYKMTDKGSKNNAYKLFLMSMFRDPAEFYNLFCTGLSDEKAWIDSNGKMTLQASDDAKQYWSSYSFLPCKGDLNTDSHSSYSDYKDNKALDPGDEDYWKKEMAIATSLPSGHYENCNALAWSSKASPLLKSMNSEFTFRNIEGSSKTSLVGKLEELVTYKPKAYTAGREYNVLEIEAARVKDATRGLDPVLIERLIPYSTVSYRKTLKLTVKAMGVAEFNSKRDVLTSEYDLIYIGNNIDGLWHEDGKTLYSSKSSSSDENSNMNGTIYTHVGAAAYFINRGVNGKSQKTDNSNGCALFGKSGDTVFQSSGQLHYSGTDITSVKKAELKTYIKTGLPVIIQSKLLKDAKDSNVKTKGSAKRTDYFWDTSHNNMFKFIRDYGSMAVDTGFNYRVAKSGEASKTLERLTADKPTITVTSMKNSKKSYDRDEVAKKNLVFEFSKDSLDRKLTFSYKISSNAYSDFMTELYIDKNADGVYDADEMVGSKKCLVGTNSFAFSINTNYHGAFTWKLVAYPNKDDKKGLVCSQEGYGTIRLDGGEKRDVHVLQVQAVKGDKTKHATSWGYDKAQQVNLKKDFSSYFAKSEVKNDFNIMVTVIDLQQFTYGSDGKSKDGKWYDEYYKENLSRNDLEKYNMIVFGFADSYRDMEFNDVRIAEDVQAFIDSKRSVLFTHDLTSQINDTSVFGETDASGNTGGSGIFMETTNGKGFNRYMRDAMGLNRFGQKVWAKESSKQRDTYDSSSTGEKFGFTYTALMQYCNFRFAHSGGSNSDSNYKGPYKGLCENYKSTVVCDYNSSHYFPDIKQGYETTKVTAVNEGQITKYPFDLSKYADDEGKYTIAATHGQAYQLDLDTPNAVCWFALSDSGSSGWYSTSPNDGANNYYIYNMGNVTYTGVGHSSAGEMTSFEKELFVNTMIASLRAGIEGPSVTIDNGVNIPKNGEDRKCVYSDIDTDSSDEDYAKDDEIVFFAKDDSRSDNEAVYIAIEMCTGTEVTEVTEDDGSVKKVETPIYKEMSKDELLKMGFKENFLTIAKGSAATTLEERPNKQIGDGEEKHNVWKIDKMPSKVSGTKNMNYSLKIPRVLLKPGDEKGIYSQSGIVDFRLVVYNTQGATGYTNGAVIRNHNFKLD